MLGTHPHLSPPPSRAQVAEDASPTSCSLPSEQHLGAAHAPYCSASRLVDEEQGCSRPLKRARSPCDGTHAAAHAMQHTAEHEENAQLKQKLADLAEENAQLKVRLMVGWAAGDCSPLTHDALTSFHALIPPATG